MKILFVDSSADLPIQYLEPLRNRGWGVIRARSLEDADRMMRLHGDQLDGVVVGEKFVSFAEKHEPSFVVLTREWGESEIGAHRNSANPAVAYLSYGVAFEQVIEAFRSAAAPMELAATGTDGPAIAELPLEDFSDILSQKEPTKNFTRTLTLNAPRFLLGGVDTQVPEPAAEEFPQAVPGSAPGADYGSTTILDRTQVADALGLTDDTAVVEGGGYSLEAELGAELGAAVEESFSGPGAPAGIPQYSSRFQHTSSGGGSDLDTLKNYLALREQDVAVLSGQFRSSQERVKQLEGQIKMERARSAELQQLLLKSEQKVKGYDQEKQIELEVIEKQMEDLNSQLKDRTEKVRTFEAKLKLTHEEISRVKERVKVDIRKIRVREKELESQLEILKKDSSALIQARDEKILELKRKLDLLEFNMELVQEQFQKERQTADDLKSRLRDAAEAMKHANGLLEQ
jgi:hypothetical protein